MPNLLGFSIGALAIVLAFPSATVFRLLAEQGADKSFYMGLCARLLHFVIAQVLAIIFTIFAKTYNNCFLNFFGCIIFFYAIIVAVAAALSVFGAARIANAASEITENDLDDTQT